MLEFDRGKFPNLLPNLCLYIQYNSGVASVTFNFNVFIIIWNFRAGRDLRGTSSHLVIFRSGRSCLTSDCRDGSGLERLFQSPVHSTPVIYGFPPGSAPRAFPHSHFLLLLFLELKYPLFLTSLNSF